jgi:hypothetical protein
LLPERLLYSKRGGSGNPDCYFILVIGMVNFYKYLRSYK